jgi:hypothetical protein
MGGAQDNGHDIVIKVSGLVGGIARANTVDE